MPIFIQFLLNPKIENMMWTNDASNDSQVEVSFIWNGYMVDVCSDVNLSLQENEVNLLIS